MEDDRERPYSVLTKDDLKEKMKKQIHEISEVFLLSKPEATVLLMYVRWDKDRISYFLAENKEKLFTESGLKSVAIDSNQDLSEISCEICSKIGDKFYEFDDDKNDDGDIVDDDLIISTPFCSHKFCLTCWRDYLEKNFYSVEKTQTSISCPHQDCRAAVGPDTIEKLTIRDEEMYNKYVLRSYLEGDLEFSIKKCPAPDCNYSIEFPRELAYDEDSSLNMVCLCGHIFCGKCLLESHRPVTCNNASDWLSRDLNKLLSLSWIDNNTKPCPSCLSPVVLDGSLSGWFLTCTCSFSFCWKCSQSKEYHKLGPEFSELCTAPILEKEAQVEISCLDRWEACKISMEQAKSNLQALEKSKINYKNLRKGLMLIVQCRQVLKWTCVYDYLHAKYESSKREYLRFLQEQATALVQSYSVTLKKETERALSAKYICLRGKSYIYTSDIGNYFYHFIKTLQDGLDDVKVKSYSDYGGPYWLCDRCTSGNSWLHKECKICYDATASPKELSD